MTLNQASKSTSGPSVTCSVSAVACNPESERTDPAEQTFISLDHQNYQPGDPKAPADVKTTTFGGGVLLDHPPQTVKIFKSFEKSSLGISGQRIRVLIDSGCNGISIISNRVHKLLGLNSRKLSKPLEFQLADGSPCASTKLSSKIKLFIGNHSEFLYPLVANISDDLILGLAWLESHNPEINWEDRRITFGKSCIDSSHCTEIVSVYYADDKRRIIQNSDSNIVSSKTSTDRDLPRVNSTLLLHPAAAGMDFTLGKKSFSLP